MHAELLDYGGLSLTFTEYSANFPFPPTVAAWSELTLRTSMSSGRSAEASTTFLLLHHD